MLRKPAAAGGFYPDNAAALKKEVEKYLVAGEKRRPALGLVAPHAGFKYSGQVAGAVYSRIAVPETVILLGPNHSGLGERVSVMCEGSWAMPFGEVPIDEELAQAICRGSQEIQADTLAHSNEHSLETQLPFLQSVSDDFKIVPICLGPLSFEACQEVARAIFDAVDRLGRSVLVVASSDMTHYESEDQARIKDQLAIEKMEAQDPKGLYETVADQNITMCGVVPVTVMMLCVNRVRRCQTETVLYCTSGDVTGDRDHVVAYLGMVFN